MPELDVHPELRVPFQPDPFHVEGWLRAERPGLKRLVNLVDSQPPQFRPQLRRLIRGAAEAIVESGGTSLDEREAVNHAKHLLADEEGVGLFTTVDVVPVDPNAEKDAQIAQAKAAQEAAEAEVARLRALLDEAPTGDPEDGEAGVAAAAVVDVPDPEPTEAEVAASAALLDAALEGDLDDDEVPDFSGPLLASVKEKE